MRTDKKYYITLATISIIFLITLCAVVTLVVKTPLRVNGGISCNINNIEYRNVTPYVCWRKAFPPEYCPMPKDVSCNINGNIPISTELINYFEMRNW